MSRDKVRVASLYFVCIAIGVSFCVSAVGQSLTQLRGAQWDLAYDAGEYRRALPIAQQMLKVAERGSDRIKVAEAHHLIALSFEYSQSVPEAIKHYVQAIEIYEDLGDTYELDLGWVLNDAGNASSSMGHKEAGDYLQRALALRKKNLPANDPLIAGVYLSLGNYHRDAGEHAVASENYRQALAAREAQRGENHPEVAAVLKEMAFLERARGQTQAGLDLLEGARRIYEQRFGAESSEVAAILADMGNLHGSSGRADEALRGHELALAIAVKQYGADDPRVVYYLTAVADSKLNLYRLGEAEADLRRCLAILDRAGLAESPEAAEPLHRLAHLYHDFGRYMEAQRVFAHALKISEHKYGADNPATAHLLKDLGHQLIHLGKYAEAEPLLLRAAMASSDGRLGMSGPDVLNRLSELYSKQMRYDKSDEYLHRTIDAELKLNGKSPHYAGWLFSLAEVQMRKKQWDDAEKSIDEGLRILESQFGHEKRGIAHGYAARAELAVHREQAGDSIEWQRRSLSLTEQIRGAEHPDVASYLTTLAQYYAAAEQFPEAVAAIERASRILDRFPISPDGQYELLATRAKIAYADKRPEDAIEDLRSALLLAEEQRLHFSGAEQERAASFAEFRAGFELMLHWLLEDQEQNAGEAFNVMERARARSLLDELMIHGADLQAGRSQIEVDLAKRRETELRSKIAMIQSRQLGEEEKISEADLESLTTAKRELYEFYRDERNANPVYRDLLSAGAKPVRLSAFQRQALTDGGLLLAYFVGENSTHLFVAEEKSARLFALGLDDTIAKQLGVKAGPLTADVLHKLLVGDDSNGIVAQLADAKLALTIDPQLAALAKVLLPAEVQQRLVSPDVRRAIIVPDGVLSLLPLETLRIATNESPEYLIDVGPPMQYAPSATTLYNLAGRVAARRTAGPQVLAVGDPEYRLRGTPQVAAASVLDSLKTSTRFLTIGGKLQPLPYSGREARWVKQLFDGVGMETTLLDKTAATEAKVCELVRGRVIIHLACHGFADNSHGNYFGALALARGDGSANPANDGFLSLGEIYALDLTGCELAILSACRTNFGPQQKGEGTWAISRGFLVAGSRRVVASNWLVDDEAGANLVSYFCSGITKSKELGKSPDYAHSLHVAKKKIREQEQWKSPYFWSSFVLVGPN